MADNPPAREAWLRGPVDGVSSALQPVAHALIQADEDLRRLLGNATDEELWARPGGAAPVGFHVLHLTGSLDRLLTYARGEALSETQQQALAREKSAPGDDARALLETSGSAIAAALEQLRTTPDASLDEVREVGRARVPATVRGLLVHAAEHTTRHVGQAITTLKIVRGLAASSGGR